MDLSDIQIYMEHAAPNMNMEANLAHAERVLRRASGLADIVVFPECYLQGYGNKKIEQVAVNLFNPVFGRIASMVRETGVAIVMGFIEELDGNYYDSCFFMTKEGKIISVYKKVHLYWSGSKCTYEKSFTPGFTLGEVFDYMGVNFSLLICYDVDVPEAARVATLKGADVILMPASHPNPMISLTVRVRARENKIFIALANTDHKNSIFCHPTGEPLKTKKLSVKLSPSSSSSKMPDLGFVQVYNVAASEVRYSRLAVQQMKELRHPWLYYDISSVPELEGESETTSPK